MLQVEVWPPAAPRFVVAPSNALSASAPADRTTEATDKSSNIVYEGGAAPDHTRPSRSDAPAADSAGRPKPAAPASSASVMTGSNAGDSYDDSDRAYPAASNRPQSSEGQDREHLLQQRELRADEGPAFAKSGIEGRGIRRTMGGAAGGGPESADGRPEANESKHAGKHGRQQQQQSPRSGSTDGVAGSGTSPHKHIGQLLFCHQLVCG